MVPSIRVFAELVETEAPSPTATAPTVVSASMVASELASTCKSPSPDAVTVESCRYDLTTLLKKFSESVTPTAILTSPTLKANESISAAIFDLSEAETSTSFAELTCDLEINVLTSLVRIFFALVTPEADDPPNPMAAAALAACVTESMVASSLAVIET